MSAPDVGARERIAAIISEALWNSPKDGRWEHTAADRILAALTGGTSIGHIFDEDGDCERCGEPRECRPVEVRTVRRAALTSETEGERIEGYVTSESSDNNAVTFKPGATWGIRRATLILARTPSTGETTHE